MFIITFHFFVAIARPRLVLSIIFLLLPCSQNIQLNFPRNLFIANLFGLSWRKSSGIKFRQKGQLTRSSRNPSQPHIRGIQRMCGLQIEIERATFNYIIIGWLPKLKPTHPLAKWEQLKVEHTFRGCRSSIKEHTVLCTGWGYLP